MTGEEARLAADLRALRTEFAALKALLYSGVWPNPMLHLGRPGPDGRQGVWFPLSGQPSLLTPDTVPADLDLWGDGVRVEFDHGAPVPRLRWMDGGDNTSESTIIRADQIQLKGTGTLTVGASADTTYYIQDTTADTLPLPVIPSATLLFGRGRLLAYGTDYTIDSTGILLTTTITGSTTGAPLYGQFAILLAFRKY